MSPISPGPVAVVTGATLGIGRAVAEALAGCGFDLVLLGRSHQRGAALAGQLCRRYQSGHFHFVACDLSSFAGVRVAAKSVRSIAPRLDVLINNAGARFDTFQQSVDGCELTIATNHLGHFLLTGLLLESMLAAPSARIINVSSSAHAGATRPDSWLMTATNYDRRQAYARSKLANLLFTYELARRLSDTGIRVNAMHPGGVASGFARNNGLVSWLRHLVAHGMKRNLVSPAKGADTIVYLAAVAEAASCSGGYFYQRLRREPSDLACDPTLADQLWSLSVRLVGFDESLGPAWEYFRPSAPSSSTCSAV